MVYQVFDKNSEDTNTFMHTNRNGGATKSQIVSNQQLAHELNKPIIKKCKRRKVTYSFRDDIWGADIIKEVDLYHVLLVFLVNMNGLLL